MTFIISFILIQIIVWVYLKNYFSRPKNPPSPKDRWKTIAEYEEAMKQLDQELKENNHENSHN